jgi:L-lactate dehydrogenase complex protein LldE
MLNDKLDNVVKTDAQVLTACDSSCLMHIGGALTRRGINVKAVHLAQLLAGEA